MGRRDHQRRQRSVRTREALARVEAAAIAAAAATIATATTTIAAAIATIAAATTTIATATTTLATATATATAIHDADSDDLRRRLELLGLRGVLQNWDEFHDAPWIRRLVEVEEVDRGRRGLERRLRNAKLGRFKPFADFDGSWPKKIDHEQLEELFTLSFVEEAANVILVGPNGVGKTMIAPSGRGRSIIARVHPPGQASGSTSLRLVPEPSGRGRSPARVPPSVEARATSAWTASAARDVAHRARRGVLAARARDRGGVQSKVVAAPSSVASTLSAISSRCESFARNLSPGPAASTRKGPRSGSAPNAAGPGERSTSCLQPSTLRRLGFCFPAAFERFGR